LKRLFALFLTIAVLASFNSVYAAAPGGADDPLISLSYLPDYISNILNKADNLIEETLGKFKDTINKRLAQMSVTLPSGEYFAYNYKKLYLDSGGSVTIKTGGSVNLISGTARITGLTGAVINVSDGTVVGKGQTINANNRYFAAENTSVVFTVFSDTATLSVNGGYTVTEGGALPSNADFKDIDGHWAKDYILYLALNNYVNGMGQQLFEPNYKMSRAMFVTLVGRIYGVQQNSYTASAFGDVDITEWYGPYVAWAAQNGIVNGFEDGTFLPNQTITREQMALVIMRFADFQNFEMSASGSGCAFSDDQLISSWAKSAVYEAQSAGIIKGRDTGAFDPKGTATRAEVCTMLYRYINALLNT